MGTGQAGDGDGPDIEQPVKPRPLVDWPWPWPCHRDGHIWAEGHSACVMCGIRYGLAHGSARDIAVQLTFAAVRRAER